MYIFVYYSQVITMVIFAVIGGGLYFDITKRYKHITKEEGIQNRFVSQALTQMDKWLYLPLSTLATKKTSKNSVTMYTELKNDCVFRTGVFFFVITNMVFSNMGAIEMFIKERNQYM